MNQVVLVGRLTSDPEIRELTDGTYRTTIRIAVSRDYKNLEGNNDADFVKCVLWNGIAGATKNYCHKGDLVGIRGKLQSYNFETSEKEYRSALEVIVEKITFISTKKVEN